MKSCSRSVPILRTFKQEQRTQSALDTHSIGREAIEYRFPHVRSYRTSTIDEESVLAPSMAQSVLVCGQRSATKVEEFPGLDAVVWPDFESVTLNLFDVLFEL